MCSQNCQHSVLASDVVGRGGEGWGGKGREGWGGCAMRYRTVVDTVFIELCEIISGLLCGMVQRFALRLSVYVQWDSAFGINVTLASHIL